MASAAAISHTNRTYKAIADAISDDILLPIARHLFDNNFPKDPDPNLGNKSKYEIAILNCKNKFSQKGSKVKFFQSEEDLLFTDFNNGVVNLSRRVNDLDITVIVKIFQNSGFINWGIPKTQLQCDLEEIRSLRNIADHNDVMTDVELNKYKSNVESLIERYPSELIGKQFLNSLVDGYEIVKNQISALGDESITRHDLIESKLSVLGNRVQEMNSDFKKSNSEEIAVQKELADNISILNKKIDKLSVYAATGFAGKDTRMNQRAGTGNTHFLPRSSVPMISRDDWGARSPRCTSELATPVDRVIIGHTAGQESFSTAHSIEEVKGIQNYHMDSKGWDDIGYNFLIGGDGNAYEGRGWRLIGAHTKGFNVDSIGIAFMGYFEFKCPTDAALKVAKNLIRQGVDDGFIKPDYLLNGYRDLRGECPTCTKCTKSPGDALYSIIKLWPNYNKIKKKKFKLPSIKMSYS